MEDKKVVTDQPGSLPTYEAIASEHFSSILCNQEEIKLHRRQYGSHSYEVLDNHDRRLLYATEGMQVVENSWQHLISFHGQDNKVQFASCRPLTWTRGCCCCAGEGGCCEMNVTIRGPDFKVLGIISQMKTTCSRHYALKDASNETKFIVKGPCCAVKGGGVNRDFPFEVVTRATGTSGPQDEVVGLVIKCYSNFQLEAYGTGTDFKIKFPSNADANMRATLIGVALLFDCFFYRRR